MEELIRSKVLFLDDRSARIHSAIEKFRDCDLTIVTNVKECLRYLSAQEWDLVFLDHDLGGNEFTSIDCPESGMSVVRYIVSTKWPADKRKPEFYLHSSNSFASATMEEWLKDAGFQVTRKRWDYGK